MMVCACTDLSCGIDCDVLFNECSLSAANEFLVQT